jgi:hypothetical protein
VLALLDALALKPGAVASGTVGLSVDGERVGLPPSSAGEVGVELPPGRQGYAPEAAGGGVT